MKYLIILIFLIFLINPVKGQGSLSMYTMYQSLPRSNQMNPALQPDQKLFISIPLISGTRFRMMSDVSFRDIFTRRKDDSLSLDLNRFLSSANLRTRLNMDISISILQIGFHALGGYIILNTSLNNHTDFSLSKDFLKLIIHGNAAPDILGKKISLRNLSQSALTYSKIGLGFSREIVQHKLTAGFRINLINGLLGFKFDNTKAGYIYTDPNNYNITINAGRLQYNTSGYDTYFKLPIKPLNIYNFKNPGFSLGIGALMQLNDKWSLSGSINNVGWIYWRSDIRDYIINNKSYTYRGINLDNIQNIKTITDTLSATFEIQNLAERFITGLQPKSYISASYHISKSQELSIIIKNSYFKNGVINTTGINYLITIGKLLDFSFLYSVYNLKYNLIGSGFSLHLKGLNFYLTSDNLAFFFRPEKIHSIDFTTGININFFDED